MEKDIQVGDEVFETGSQSWCKVRHIGVIQHNGKMKNSADHIWIDCYAQPGEKFETLQPGFNIWWTTRDNITKIKSRNKWRG